MKKLFILIWVGLAFTGSALAQGLTEEQKEALQTFYDQTDGPKWGNPNFGSVPYDYLWDQNEDGVLDFERINEWIGIYYSEGTIEGFKFFYQNYAVLIGDYLNDQAYDISILGDLVKQFKEIETLIMPMSTFSGDIESISLEGCDELYNVQFWYGSSQLTGNIDRLGWETLPSLRELRLEGFLCSECILNVENLQFHDSAPLEVLFVEHLERIIGNIENFDIGNQTKLSRISFVGSSSDHYEGKLYGDLQQSDIFELPNITSIEFNYFNYLTGDLGSIDSEDFPTNSLLFLECNVSGNLNHIKQENIPLEAIDLRGNKLSFSSILATSGTDDFYHRKENVGGSFYFFPQQEVDEEKIIYTLPGRDVTLSANVDTAIPGCVFSWYKVLNQYGSIQYVGSGVDLEFDNLTESEAGDYYYTISHPYFSASGDGEDTPVLESHVQTIAFAECPTGDEFSFTYVYDPTVCGYYFDPIVDQLPYEACSADAFEWKVLYEDGTSYTSNDQRLLIVPDEGGEYSIALEIDYNCPDPCEGGIGMVTDVVDLSAPPVEFSITYEPFECGYYFDSVIDQLPNESCTANVVEWRVSYEGGISYTSGESRLFIEPQQAIYTIELEMEYVCPATCPDGTKVVSRVVDFSENAFDEYLTVEVTAAVYEEVLSASATTYSDSWYVKYEDEDLATTHPYLNGQAGVWRNQASFGYREDRKASASPDLDQDGTFTLDQFNWAKGDFDGIPGWLRANTVTNYSPYSQELENRDVLNNHSSAIYGYGGQLPLAVGQNMQHLEMAYTGFEQVTPEEQLIFPEVGQRGLGNWIFSENSTPAEYKTFSGVGEGNIFIANALEGEFGDVSDVQVNGFPLDIPFGVMFNRFTRWPVEVLCATPYLQDGEEYTRVALSEVLYDGIWVGTLYHQKPGTDGMYLEVSNTIAHTGNNSLYIDEDVTVIQEYLELIPSKTYTLSTWMSVNDEHLISPDLATDDGIEITFLDEYENEISSMLLEPSGAIIEGWQKLEQDFLFPIGADHISITLRKGSAAAMYFDDFRLFPSEGNMESYVYEPETFRLISTLDQNNYATYFYYDPEGNLYLTKKETERGIRTIQEVTGYMKHSD